MGNLSTKIEEQEIEERKRIAELEHREHPGGFPGRTYCGVCKTYFYPRSDDNDLCSRNKCRCTPRPKPRVVYTNFVQIQPSEITDEVKLGIEYPFGFNRSCIVELSSGIWGRRGPRLTEKKYLLHTIKKYYHRSLSKRYVDSHYECFAREIDNFSNCTQNTLRYHAISNNMLHQDAEGAEKDLEKVLLVSDFCDTNLINFVRSCQFLEDYIPYYDKIRFPDVRFEEYSEHYQKFLITLHFACNHPKTLLYRVPKEILEHHIIPFICRKEYRSRNSIYFEDIIDILCQISNGMKDLHQRGIYMGVIDPKDIFLRIIDTVNPNNRQLSVKIGCSFRDSMVGLGNVLNEWSYTQYTPPELIIRRTDIGNENDLDIHERFLAKIDCYSFGILMYEILCKFQNAYRFSYHRTGKPESAVPQNFHDESEFLKHVAKKALNDEGFRPNFEAFYEIPGWYSGLAELCWSEDYSRRPSFERICYVLGLARDSENDESDSSSVESDEE